MDLNSNLTNKIVVNPKKFPYSYILNHEYHRKDFESQVCQWHAHISIDDDNVEICSQDKKFSEWLENYEGRFSCNEWLIMPNQIENIKTQIQQLNLNENLVKLTYSDAAVKLEGLEIFVELNKPKIDAIMSNLPQISQNEMQDLTIGQCSLLLKEGLVQDMAKKYSNLVVEVLKDKGIIKFKGEKSDIEEACNEVKSLIDKIKPLKIDLSDFKVIFMQNRSEFVGKYLSDAQLKCEYEFNENKLCFYAIDLNDLQKAQEIVSKLFIERECDARKTNVDFVFEQYKKFIGDELNASHQGIIFVKDKQSENAVIVSEKSVLEQFDKILKNECDVVKYANKQNSNDDQIENDASEKNDKKDHEKVKQFGKSLKLFDNQMEFIKTVKEKEIKELVDSKYKCKLSYRFHLNNLIIQTSTPEALDEFIHKIYEMLKSEMKEIYELSCEEDVSILEEDLQKISQQSECIIKIDKVVKEPDYCLKAEINDNLNFYVVNGSISEIKDVDVVAITIGENQKPTNVLGDKIWNLLNSIAPRNEIEKEKTFSEADVNMSNDNDSYRGKRVAYVKVNVDKFNKNNWRKSVENILKLVDTEALRSVAIPFLATDDMNKHEEEIAKSTIKPALEYFEKLNKNSQINKIYFVSPEKKYCDEFEKIINVKVDKQKIKKSKIKGFDRIRIEIGSILDEKFKCDAIVNTTSFKLNLQNGTVSKQILKKAGWSIQKELDKKYPSGINNDTLVAVSTAGDLKFTKNILHISLYEWRAGDKEIENYFKKVISEILLHAEALKCKSVAIPAIGTGILQYPIHLCAEWMFTSIEKYFKENPNSIIDQVLLVLYDKDIDTIDAFKDYEKKMLENEIQKMDSQKIKTSTRFILTSDKNERIDRAKYALKDALMGIKKF